MMSEPNEKSATAAQLVRTHMFGAAVAAILPVPLLDIAVLGGVQLRMLRKLAALYEVEFSEQRAKTIIGALVGVGITGGAAGVLKMLLPGTAKIAFGVGALTIPPASTYALGRVFIQHFESGGTIWTFDPARAKQDYDKEVGAGQKVVAKQYSGIKP
jgi:uncharacterized protein (DUF697 family)